MDPFVSICCITYNQENFVEKAIQGFLNQRTNFPIEILIHDDASLDNTPSVIKKYQNVDERIIVIYQKENQYNQGKKPFINFLFPKAKGKYIALCEGDDYWTDPYKLQKQVDFLEKNQDYSACFTNALLLDEESGKTSLFFKPSPKLTFTIQDIINKGGGLFPTASLVFRNKIKIWPDFIFEFKSGDRSLSLLLANLGKFYLINDVTCVYRTHAGGIFNSIKNDQLKRKEITVSNIELLRKFNLFTHFKYQKSILQAISRLSKKALLKDKNTLFNKNSHPLIKNLELRDKLSLIYSYFFSRF